MKVGRSLVGILLGVGLTIASRSDKIELQKIFVRSNAKRAQHKPSLFPFLETFKFSSRFAQEVALCTGFAPKLDRRALVRNVLAAQGANSLN